MGWVSSAALDPGARPSVPKRSYIFSAGADLRAHGGSWKPHTEQQAKGEQIGFLSKNTEKGRV